MSEASPLWNLSAVGLGTRLDQVTLRIERGVTAIIGYSGAGKTSLVRLLVGMEKPDRGMLESCARPFWVPQNGGLWPHVSVRGHLEIAGGGDVEAMLSHFDLAHRADARPDRLSQGECSRLAVARALMTRADVLVMDEPLVHVDPARVGKYWDFIRRHLAETGASLVFATHLPGDALGEAQQAVCLKHGRLLYSGSVEKLYHRPETPELAECLGATNWFDEPEAQRWLGPVSAAGCYRPERLEMVPDGDGLLIVVASRFRGAVAETTVRDPATGAVRSILHRPLDAWTDNGMRVTLRVRAGWTAGELAV